MINNKQLRKIKEFAINIDWNKSFSGKSKGNRHLFRIVNISKKIAENYDVDNGILEAGAWLHDTNLEKTITGETLANKEKIIRFFNKIKVNRGDQEKILHCIESHDGRIKATTNEAKIVHDADTLEKMGPLGVIRETWKRSQLGWTTEKIIEHLKIHLKKRENNIYTKEAKKIAFKLNKKLKIFFIIVDKQIEEM